MGGQFQNSFETPTALGSPVRWWPDSQPWKVILTLLL